MREDFLHYVWRFKKMDVLQLQTSKNEPIVIVNSGEYLELSGPDFFNAQLIIGNQKWAGNIEIHVKSSDWYSHNHELDSAYENVILHVVWEHDTDVFRKDNSEIPTLELKHYVESNVLENYNYLNQSKKWIYCENQINQVSDFVFQNWKERLFLERLEKKSDFIVKLLQASHNDWEAVLFFLLSKNFGLNINGDAFLKMAQSLTFDLVRKEAFELENLEALFFGQLQLLAENKEDAYFKDLQFRYFYLAHKYQLDLESQNGVQFFKLRPDNFPTIRLAQLANLFHLYPNLFSKIIELKSIDGAYTLLQVGVSCYWKTHFVFDKSSHKRDKMVSKSFVDLVLINTIIPFQFVYAKLNGTLNIDFFLEFMDAITPEKNSIIEKFFSLDVKVKSALDSQALLHLKNEYCNHNKCLSCAIGVELLK
ncbi:DUF2851 family protein [Flavobacterium agrisoli]|uniref:DUF2851 family protein n=1 Tax=Flavobacterium agrisoli TaxID=2793066 RepID=A0A934PNI8_9FLAO|nr:DUF2851 family protein [Flavobacterium agrisoli]MBK0370465.1 DUF2851 family protein [Flavobacterium agrisoli]